MKSVKMLVMHYSYRVWPMAFNMQSVYTEYIYIIVINYTMISETFTNTVPTTVLMSLLMLTLSPTKASTAITHILCCKM